MKKINPSNPTMRQSVLMPTCTINVKWGSFSLSSKALENMKLKAGDRLSIYEAHNGGVYFQPTKAGDFVLRNNQKDRLRLRFTDKGVAKEIQKKLLQKQNSFVVNVTNKPIGMEGETNLFKIYV